jgi:hypothetical protein
MTEPELCEAHKYIRRIRNKEKRAYAQIYLRFLCGQQPEPDRGKVSYMAAQAIRIELHSIAKEHP